MADYEDENWEGYRTGEQDMITGDAIGAADLDSDNPDNDDNEAVQSECLTAFGSVDYIMEPEVFNMLKRYFKAAGQPELVVQLLSDNYVAVSQTANMLAEWLIHTGVELKDVQEIVENHLKSMIIKHFDPKKADSIFTDEGETPAWLAEMIEYPTWRALIYSLAEEYPDCLMLNFTVKLISDAGYQGEITSVSTACHQIEVFSRVLRTFITSYLENGEDFLKKDLAEFTKMVCHGEHTYLYTQLLLHSLSQEKGGSRIKRLSQELERYAMKSNLYVTPISLALSGASAYPRACQALSAMLSKNALNPADITILYKMYMASDPPPVKLLHAPQLLDMFIDALFKPGCRINPDHKSKYIYLLAYASSIVETWRHGQRKSINNKEFQSTSQAIERTHALCQSNKGSSELTADIGILFTCIKIPIVAMGVTKWVEATVCDSNYFKLNTDHNPLHIMLLDEVSANHVLLHQRVLDLLIKLFEMSVEELDVLVQMELKKTLLDRMVHLLSHDCVLPVVSYIKKCWEQGDTDVSLIRYFVTEVLDIITKPYTTDFVQLFAPLVENEDITGSLRSENHNDPVSDFLLYYKTVC